MLSYEAVQIIANEAATRAANEAAMRAANEAATRAANEAAERAANEAAARAANEATNRAIAALRPSGSDIVDDVNLDKEMRRAFYKKMTTPSFGETLASQLDNKLAGEFISKIMPNIFGSGGNITPPEPKEKGIVGFVLDILNTQFAYGAGQTMGSSATEIIKSLGTERVGKMIDSYQQKMTGGGGEGQQTGGIQETSPEESQRKRESILMSLDSSNSNDVNNFMQATGIGDYTEAQKVILVEQDKILQKRGLKRVIESPSPSDDREIRGRPRSRHDDINRQLIEQYDEPPLSHASSEPHREGFFNDDTQEAPFEVNRRNENSAREDEFILSLNPDDPVSQQQYMAHRRIAGVPPDVVKKMMIKEQNKFRDVMMKGTPVQEQKPIHSHITNSPENSVQDSVQDNEVRIINKKEFYKEIGLDKTGINKPEIVKEMNQVNESQKIIPHESSEDIKNIMDTLQKIGQSFDNSMKQMNENFDINIRFMNEKIEYLENEIMTLRLQKGSEDIKDVSFEPIDARITDEQRNEEHENKISEKTETKKFNVLESTILEEINDDIIIEHSDENINNIDNTSTTIDEMNNQPSESADDDKTDEKKHRFKVKFKPGGK